MTNDSVSIWQMFRNSIRGIDSNRQLALGVVFGMMIGLIPKDSLFCYAMVVLMMLTTANLFCAILSGLAFTWLAPLLDPITHLMGNWLLTIEGLESTWASLYETPVLAWTRFQNTVVTGSLLLGLLAAIPLYNLSYRFFKIFGNTIHRRLKQSRLAQLFGIENSDQAILASAESVITTNSNV